MPLSRALLFVLAATLALVAWAPTAAAAADPPKRLLTVPAGQPLEGADVIARYEGFSLVSAGDAAARRLVRAGARARDDLQTVVIQGREVDPARDRPAISPPASGRALALVQLAGPVKGAWIARVAATGARPLMYLPQNAYVVSADRPQARRLAALAATDPAVRAVVAFEPPDKIAPGLPREGRVRVAVQTAAGSDGAHARETVRRAARVLRAGRPIGALRTHVAELGRETIDALAEDPGVLAIEPSPEPRLLDERAGQIVAGNLASGAPSGPGYLSWLADRGIPSSAFDAFTVDVTDSGLDDGVLDSAHPDFHVGGDGAGASRVGYLRNATGDADARDCNGHGTNVASIATGHNDAVDAASGAGGAEDDSGFNYGLGIAPSARLGATKIFNCADAYDVPSSVTHTDLAGDAYADGARVSNNSWGADTSGDYTDLDQEYDAIVRDAREDAAGNQEIAQLVAAGNAGSLLGTLVRNSTGSPANAKNVISVGASENVRPIGGSDGCGVPDSGADDARDIIDFSSRGPTDDGRLKPDVVAPGTHVTGASPQHGGYTGNGTCNRTFAGNPLYSLVSGTSQATPEATGMAALLRAWYTPAQGAPPSPAMTKALMVNTASDQVGGDNGGGSPNANVPTVHQGWGRVNAGTLLDGTTRSFVDQTQLLDASGTVAPHSFTVADASKPVKVSLAWTDAPGSLAGAAYVNDLDLEVDAGGTTYRGNVFSGGRSVAGGSPDPRNNSENVFLPAGTTGTVHVRVGATNIAGDGVPNVNDDLTDQDFALVVSNAVAAAAANLVADAPVVADADGDGALEPGEQFALRVPLRNRGTAAAADVDGALASVDGRAVITDGTSPYPDIPVDAIRANDVAFGGQVSADAPCGSSALLDLAVTTTGDDPVLRVALPIACSPDLPDSPTDPPPSTDDATQQPSDSQPAPAATRVTAGAGPSAPLAAPDVRAPGVTLRSSRRQRLRAALRSGIAIRVRCDEACAVGVSATLSQRTARALRLRGTRVASARRSVSALRTTLVRLRLTRAARRALRRNKGARVAVRVTATDAAGNRRTLRRSVVLIG